MAPANPYAAAKVFAHQLVALYRNHYGLFTCSGILYNHESPMRPTTAFLRALGTAGVISAFFNSGELSSAAWKARKG